MYLKNYLLILVYTLSVNLFGLFVRYLEYEDLFFCYECLEEDSVNTFDYIVVGCGSAGAVVARRLAEDKSTKILVLEAGKHGNPLLNIPSFGLLLQETFFDWQYYTIPQSTSCLALNYNISHWPMGKIVGGTSMLNNMIYVRGHPKDFDEWFQDKENYNYTLDVLPYFEKLENNYGQNQGDQKGSVYVNDLSFTSLLSDLVLEAAETLGFSILKDTRSSMKGFGPSKVNMYNGRRWISSHSLLSSYKHNIYFRTKSYVQKILFRDNYEAYGVKYTYLDETRISKATKGVILAAGVIGTPKILLLSGVGPKDHLEDLGINTKVNLPVGENLQDHITTGLDLILLNQSVGIGVQQMLSPYSAFDYFWSASGPWTTPGCEVVAFLDTKKVISSQNNVQPDLQFMVMPLGVSEDNGILLRHLIGISDYTWTNYFSSLSQTAVTILPIVLHPKSRGTVRLRNTDYETMPLIDPNYLSDQYDVDILLRGIAIIKRLIKTEPMQRLGARLNRNIFPGCKQFKFDTKGYWECYVRHLTITSYHPAGTCKMGLETDPTTVVNYDFQVKGTNKLYVVDASVMPTLTSGNINGAVLMLAEMASDVIKYREFLNRGNCDAKEIFIFRDFC